MAAIEAALLQPFFMELRVFSSIPEPSPAMVRVTSFAVCRGNDRAADLFKHYYVSFLVNERTVPSTTMTE